MPITYTTDLFCDGETLNGYCCTAWVHVSIGCAKHREIVQWAKANGWLYRNRKFYCPDCAQKQKG